MELLGGVCADMALEADGHCGCLSGHWRVGTKPTVSVRIIPLGLFLEGFGMNPVCRLSV